MLTATNLVSVSSYGEFEFWFAGIKVVAIVLFIASGPRRSWASSRGPTAPGSSHLWQDGGFMPNGFGAVLAAMLITMFSFMGTEIVTIAAGESDEPERGVSKAVNSVIWRISLFYLGSIFIVVALVPWNAEGLAREAARYQFTLDAMGMGRPPPGS